ncbi:SPASM domain-containing protein [Listeria aquatica]|uniref:SPASM domain-containing protein n=1 Tax=Listeria aquatica TaxID=1494960 RepID=A0A841ZM69_9LIST|nr:radical SAM protein [Listeria aquatica]MBC1520602.1 SPASM domain-containing protein [Listeria aquatica]
MKHVSVLIKPASSLCNIRCKYCFYTDVSSLREVKSYGKMSLETAKKMIANIFIDLEEGDHLTLNFQGGEPTLAGLSYFEFIVRAVNEQMKKVKVCYAIQTNGLLIDRTWCDFLKKNQFLVGLSLDGTKELHDKNRVDPKEKGTFSKVVEVKNLFEEYQIDYNILCVLTSELASQPEQIYSFIQQENIGFIQFIPCLPDLSLKSPTKYALSPEGFKNFYLSILEQWFIELREGTYRSIKLFDDLIHLLVDGEITACGILGECQMQYVIEADGSVYPCDFYVLDTYRLGFIQELSIRQLFNRGITSPFICERKKRPSFCSKCPFEQMCLGGCKRMKDCMYVNEEENMCGYQSLLEVFIPQIDEILKCLTQVKV